MKSIRLAVLLILLCSTMMVQAHSGGTNAQGCHIDTKTGIYHCHNSGTSSSSSSYSTSASATPTMPTATPINPPPAQETITVESLLAQIKASYEDGNISQAVTLCDQLKIALDKERAKQAVKPFAETTKNRVTSPLAFETGGIKGTITFPGVKAYIYNDSTIEGGADYGGQIIISIPDALAIENKLFRAGTTVLTANYVSSKPSVLNVTDEGYILTKSPGQVTIKVIIGDVEAQIEFEVVQLPFSIYASQSQIIKALGFPDNVKGDIWFWNAYPDMCLRATTYSKDIYSQWDGGFERYCK